MPFHVGDRVYNERRGLGTVVVTDSISIGVSYDAWNGGHTCGGKASRVSNGWYMLPSDIVLVHDKPLDITELI